jgi:hypothetical protein
MSLIAQTRKSSGRHTTFAIVALGSWSMTIAALTAGPQVVAWLGLGGATSGLDDLDPGAVASGRQRLGRASSRIPCSSPW